MLETFNFNNFIFLDTETGGLDPYKDNLLSVGLVSGDGEDTMEFYVKESDNIVNGDEAKSVNNIDIELVKKIGVSPKEAISKIHSFIEICKSKNNDKNPIFVGHNIAFDLAFVRKLYSLAGYNQPRFSHRTIDTHSLIYFQVLQNKLPASSASSGEAFKLFEVHVDKTKRHTALGDAVATRELFFKLVLKTLAENEGNSFTTDNPQQKRKSSALLPISG